MRTSPSFTGRRARARAWVACAIIGASAWTELSLGATPSSWLSAESGSWTDGARWSTAPVFPNNGTPPGATYDATIAAMGAPYEVVLDATTVAGGEVVVDSLMLNAPDAHLRVGAGSLTTIGLTDLGAGTMMVDGPATLSAARVNVTGGGTLNLRGRLNTSTLTIAAASGTAMFTHRGSITAPHVELGDGGYFDQGGISFPGGFLFDLFHQTGGTAYFGEFWAGVQEQAQAYRIDAGSFEVNAGMYVGRGNDGSFVQAGGHVRVSALLNLGVFSTGRYELSGGSLESFSQVIGDRSPGIFTQTGGTNFGNGTLGAETNGSGTYTLSAGTRHVPYALRIGERGQGRFVQTGGFVQIDDTNAEFALLVGGGGQGTYAISGGSMIIGSSVRGAVIGFGVTSTGQFDLSGDAIVLADLVTIGYGGAGSFNQTGGAFAPQTLQLGGDPRGAGRYSISAGQLIPNTLSIGAGVVAGNGTFVQSGGTVAVTQAMAISRTPQSRGHYELSGGDLVTPTLTVAEAGPASFVQSGGTASIGELLEIHGEGQAVGSYQLSGGALQVTGRLRIDGPGSMLFSGGRLSAATLELQDDARLITTTSDKVIRACALVASDSDWVIDLADNAMILDYDAGASPIEFVRQAVSSAYADGAWTGGKLTSSTAAAAAGSSHPTGIGYAEAAEVFSAFPASFEGEPVDSTAVLVKHTLYGDANLDGVVNLRDFDILAANYGQTARRWSHGDFTYGGAVTLADFNLLAANFGYQATGPTVSPRDWSTLAAVVPEPALLGVAAPLIPLMRRRRRAAAAQGAVRRGFAAARKRGHHSLLISNVSLLLPARIAEPD